MDHRIRLQNLDTSKWRKGLLVPIHMTCNVLRSWEDTCKDVERRQEEENGFDITLF